MNNYDRIDAETIGRLNIDMSLCNDWTKESFLLKESSILPAKTPIRLSESVFITTMPCAIPSICMMGNIARWTLKCISTIYNDDKKYCHGVKFGNKKYSGYWCR